jgi:hypothetical protein
VRIVLVFSSNSSTLAVSPSPVSDLYSLELLEGGSSLAGSSSTTDEDLLW